MFAKRPFLFAKSAIFGKHVCNNICFFYAFLNIMGYVNGRIPDQRSHKIKNSVPSKKLDFTLFSASVKGFEPPAFRLGGERSILLSYTDLFTFFGLFIHLINRQKSRGDCSTSALGVNLGPGFTAPHFTQNPLFSAKSWVLVYVNFVLYLLLLNIRVFPVCFFLAILQYNWVYVIVFCQHISTLFITQLLTKL